MGASKDSGDFSWLHCLVVDDSQFITEYTRALLLEELQVASVYCARTADEALDIVRHHRVHVALCDLNMEGVDGFELIRMLKDAQFAGHVGIISSMPVKVIKSSEQLTQLHDLNLLGSILKPVSADALRALLSNIQRNPKRQLDDTSPLRFYEFVRALEQQEFEVYYQPKVGPDRRLIAVEALVRMHSASRGLVPPVRFIPQMEKTPLINSLSSWVLMTVVNDWASWKESGVDLAVAVNVSPKDLTNLEFPDDVYRELSAVGMPCSRLSIEVTESALDADDLTTLEVLNRLAIRGIQLSMDDFGAGQTSFERLHKLPFQELKIDKAFVLNAKSNERDRAALESALVMARRVGMSVTLEGVESAELYDMAINMNCDALQGFFIAKPMSKGELLEWLEHWHCINL